MVTDNYFEIGSTHDVCQDYALSGKINDNLSYAIITDGCSQSHKECGEVDLGARIVAYAARESLKGILEHSESPSMFKVDFQDILQSIIFQVQIKIIEIGNSLNLNKLFSDSTLVIAISNGDLAYVYVFGDGGVIVKKKDGTIIYDEISYLSSAPYYISYSIDKEREKQYLKEFGASPVIHTNHIFPFDGGIEDVKITHKQAKEINHDIYTFSSFIYDNFSSVSVTSDGIKSFQALEEENKDIRTIEMVPKFVDFKSKNPVFLKRRMLMVKKENTIKKISHYDDISVASIMP